MSIQTTQCKHCGNSLELEIPDEAGLARDYALRFAPMTVHNGCAYQMEQNQRDVSEDLRLLKAMQTWQHLVPPLYHTSGDWILATDSKTLNRAKVMQVIAWQFGSKGLFLYGEKSGTGKTTAAYLITKSAIANQKRCAVFSHSEFSRKASFLTNTDQQAGSRWIKLVNECDLLVIDDFGKSRFKTADGTSKQAEELLFDILDSRIANKRPTILTSNDNAATLRARLSAERGEPLLRRLREFFEPVNFDK